MHYCKAAVTFKCVNICDHASLVHVILQIVCIIGKIYICMYTGNRCILVSHEFNDTKINNTAYTKAKGSLYKTHIHECTIGHMHASP